MKAGDRAVVVGAGSWGTALAWVLARGGYETLLYARRGDQAERIAACGENEEYLPGCALPEGLTPVSDLPDALQGTGLVVIAVPSPWFRDACRRISGSAGDGTLYVSVSKGIEEGSLRRMSEVMAEELPGGRYTVLSGPSFAREVVREQPTAVVVASEDEDAAREVQGAFSGSRLRLYTNRDVVGVELGGAVKNVIAIAAGAVEGLGLGTNTLAALITRGLAEMRRLALPLGAQADTLSGLSGLGDLVLTCTGALSRNRQVGARLAEGETLAAIEASMRMVAEGIRTTLSVCALADMAGVEVPIAQTVNRILNQRKPPREAVEDLMGRELKEEFWS
jgi:glycerol-3-phosphate dehydrogenase (NAD(P)+)